MAIEINSLPKYREAIATLSAQISKGASTEEQEKLFATAFNTLGEELLAKNNGELNKMFGDRQDNRDMSAEEIKFFNDVATIKKDVGTKNPVLLPEETMEQVFEDLKVEHPLLSIINFKNTSLRLKAITAETSGTAAWGKIFGEIKGQLDQKFTEKSFHQNKLTAFVVIPKDALNFGPKWIKTFVIEQIKEAISVALELAIVKGNGLLQPVGLIKDLSKPTVDQTTGEDVTVYNTDKEAVAVTDITPANAPKKFAPVMKTLSVNDKGIQKQIAGKVYLLVNPVDKWELEAAFTTINANGVYVNNLPFGIKLVESMAVDAGKAVAFVSDRYDAYMASRGEIESFDQTLAVEDLQLYTTKAYFYGKAKDNHAAVLLTLTAG